MSPVEPSESESIVRDREFRVPRVTSSVYTQRSKDNVYETNPLQIEQHDDISTSTKYVYLEETNLKGELLLIYI